MKKILVAMENETLQSQIKKCGKYNVHLYDIDTKENVIEYLNQNEIDVLITKDSLKGNMTDKEYINKLSEINNMKVILCVSKLDEEYKGFLLAKNISNIIEGNEISFSKVIEMIDSKEGLIRYKEIKNVEKDKSSKSEINIMTKQKICVFGTSGAGKSYISSILAQIASKKLKLNTLLVDMDVQNAAIDIYNNLTNSANNLGYLMEEMDRDTFTSELLKELASKSIKNGKLSFITNNMGIYECQNKLSDTYYERLYKEAENSYDVLILDLPATPFLDIVPFSLTKSDKIFFVLNPNYISIRQAIKYLDLIINIWNIDKDKIYIVINKYKKESLSESQIASLFKDYNIVLSVKYDDKVEKIINGMEEITLDSVDKMDKLGEVFGVRMPKMLSKGEKRWL